MSEVRVEVTTAGWLEGTTWYGRRISPLVGWLSFLALGAALVLIAQNLPSGAGRAVLELPVVLLLPGYALFSGLLGRSTRPEIVLLGLFSFGLSLGVMILDALVLNASGIRLTETSFVMSMFVSTSVFAMWNVATARGPLWWYVWTENAGRSLRRAMTRGVLLAVSISFVVGAISFEAHRLPSPKTAPFASLSLGPTWATQGTALRVVTDQLVTIPVVASSDGDSTSHFLLTTAVDGKTISERTIRLSDNSDWKGDVRVIAPSGHSLHRVTVTLSSDKSTKQSEQVIVYLDNA